MSDYLIKLKGQTDTTPIECESGLNTITNSHGPAKSLHLDRCLSCETVNIVPV